MGTIPTPPTIVAGQAATAAVMNQYRDVQNFWSAPPECLANQSVAVSIANASWAVVPLDAEVYDHPQAGDAQMHDVTTNNSRIYLRTAGTWEVTGMHSFASNATGYRLAQIRTNAAGVATGGTQVANVYLPPVSGQPTTCCFAPTLITANAGDYLEMFVYQTSGAALNSQTGRQWVFLRARLIAP